MYRLNVQVTAYGRQTVPDRGVVRSCDPLQNFGGSNHIQSSRQILYTSKIYQFQQRNRITYHQQKSVVMVT